MERGNLTFLDSYTVEQFKDLMKVSRILVKKNPKNNNLFFTFGAQVGAVAVKGIPTHPMISRVQEGTEEPFYLLHEEGAGAPVLAEF